MVVAPATATQVEARFLVPPGNQIVVDAVSLAASTDLISNSDLAVVGDDGIIGWDAPPDLAVSSVEGTVLHNLDGEVATAAQQVTVAGGSSYILEFTGRALAPNAAAPHIELAWADSAGTTVGKAVIHDVDVLAMDRHLIEGVVPDSAAAARIALVLPPSARLEVHRVSLRTPHRLQVPVSFRAHSPGQLIVSGAAVGLEETEPATPPVPASGLCSPTPPGVKPGHEFTSCYCPACGAQSSLRKATPAVTSAGRPAALVKCEHCKAEVVALGGRLEPDAISLRQRRNTSVDFDLTANQPVVVVDGIGPARSAQLAALGITRLGHLAAAPIEWLARAKSLSLTNAREIRNEARRLLFHTDTAPETPHRRL
jgi:predicted flap endonuclease-1-like 5' DNA nuclease